MTIEGYFKNKGAEVAYVSGFNLPSTFDAWKVIALMASLPDVIIGTDEIDTFPSVLRKLAIDNGFDVEGSAFLTLPTSSNEKGISIETGKWLKVESFGALDLTDLCLIDGEPDFVIINGAVDTLIAVTTEEDGLYVFIRNMNQINS